jgi:Major Facilitator Superfamily
MQTTSVSPEIRSSRTRLALLWMKLSEEPLVALYSLLPFILRKDLSATTLQLSLFIALRPVLSLFSFYWSSNLIHRRNKLLTNLMGANFLARFPFLLVPWIDSPWYILFAAGCYQLFSRAGVPALMEILKINVPKETRETAYTRYFVWSFIESILLGLSIGSLLDYGGSSWKILIFLCSLIGMSSLIFQRRIPIDLKELSYAAPSGIKHKLFGPWKRSFNLIRSRPDFAHFQWCFMIGGFGLMLIAPASSIYYADVLSLSHIDLAIGRCIFMGLGVTFSAYFWRRGIRKNHLFQLLGVILTGFALFPFLLLFAQLHVIWLYFAFLLYGVAQAGSHLIWNLSGTLFSAKEDSSQYSTANILMVGIRGAVGPMIGGLLCHLIGPITVLVLGMMIFLVGGILALRKRSLFTISDCN